MKKYFEGLKFGMLLQFAIGPMCLMVFNTAKNTNFFHAFCLVLAIALADAIYIILAGVGTTKLLKKDGIKKFVKIVGAMVLILFGFNIILSVWGISLIPAFSITANARNIFIQGLIMTLSNPLTIVFWGSILTNKIIEDNLGKSDLVFFSTGLVSATVFFMTCIAILGTILKSFIPTSVSMLMNLVVGILIVYFGIKMLLKKDS